MDGKGRATDHIFVERLWRSLKGSSLSHRAVVMGQWYDTAEGGNVRALTFTFTNAKVTQVEVIGDPARLRELDIAVL